MVHRLLHCRIGINVVVRSPQQSGWPRWCSAIRLTCDSFATVRFSVPEQLCTLEWLLVYQV